MRWRGRTLLLVASTAVLAAGLGCVPKSEGERLSRELRELQTQSDRVTALETQLAEQREAFEDRLEQVRAALQSINDRLELTGRGSADLGADVTSIRETLASLEGAVAELQNNLTATQGQVREQSTQLDAQIGRLARKVGVDLSFSEAEIRQDKTEHYAAAYHAFQAADHTRARALFQEYIRRYPSDDNADDAAYWIGRGYFDQQQWSRAIAAYRDVITRYQAGDALDKTLFDMARAFYELHSCGDSRTALETLVQLRPQSPLVSQAQTRLRELRRPPRGYCTN